jgi:hypothetical protein
MIRRHRLTWLLLLSLVLQGVVVQAHARVPAPVAEVSSQHAGCHSTAPAHHAAKPMKAADCCCGHATAACSGASCAPGACQAGVAVPVALAMSFLTSATGTIAAPDYRLPVAPPDAVFRPPIA